MGEPREPKPIKNENLEGLDLRILFADKTKLNRDVLKKWIRQKYPAAHITEVEDNAELFYTFMKSLEGEFNVVFTYQNIIDTSGLNLIKSVRRKDKNTLVIMIADLDDKAFASLCQEAEKSKVFCIQKPLNADKVKQIYSVIEDWRAFK